MAEPPTTLGTDDPDRHDPDGPGVEPGRRLLPAGTAGMYAADAASNALGIELMAVEDGRCVARMTVRDDMINGLGVCHGGLVFTLADTAMAFASNAGGAPVDDPGDRAGSGAGDGRALAVQAGIDWLAPALGGRVLPATAIRIQRHGRTALHDVTVVDDEGTTVAVFRGRTRSTRRVGSARRAP